MRMFKYAFALLAFMFLVGCGEENVGEQPMTNVTMETVTESEIESKAEATTEQNETTEHEVISEVVATEMEEEVSVMYENAGQLIANMKVGWNLGNTMDSEGKLETSWGNPKTTQEMIDAVAAAGFNTIRIPTTWYCRADAEGNIDKEWLERVAEVVDYCYANDMYVILNTHHEGSWLVPDEGKIDKVEEKFLFFWKQIAEYFKEYDQHLVFEGLNEPRTIGSAKEWSGGTDKEREVINRLEKGFVETVRATGGNNETRCLLITGYAASADKQAMKAIEIPEDKYIAVSIHAYTPYRFTFYNNGNGDTKIWDESVKRDIDILFDDINELFISKGVPVIITEYGAECKNDRAGGEDNLSSRCKWVAYYVEKAKELGIPCVCWDNGIYNGSGERFGIFNRKELNWYEPEFVDAMINAAYDE